MVKKHIDKTNRNMQEITNTSNYIMRFLSSLKVAFLLSLLGLVAFLTSIFWAIVELGDPPNSQIDAMQRISFISWLSLHLLALMISIRSPDKLMARRFMAILACFVIVGLFLVI